MNTYQCPVEGCEYSGVKSSVTGHYAGKRDDAHSGGYEIAKQKLEESDPNGEVEVEPDPTTSTSNNDPSSEDPVMGSGPSFEETEPEEDLPCGHESFNPNDAPEPPFTVTCDTCEKTFRVTEL